LRPIAEKSSEAASEPRKIEVKFNFSLADGPNLELLNTPSIPIAALHYEHCLLLGSQIKAPTDPAPCARWEMHGLIEPNNVV
jgi:hypothetical protein